MNSPFLFFLSKSIVEKRGACNDGDDVIVATMVTEGEYFCPFTNIDCS